MGMKIALTLMGVLGGIYTIHTLFNTAYDWIILGILLQVMGLYMDDTRLTEFIATFKWVNRVRKSK